MLTLIYRYGHAMTVAGNIAFLFGGASSAITEVCESNKLLKTALISVFIKNNDACATIKNNFSVLRMILQYI